jgi:hypothetical protein
VDYETKAAINYELMTPVSGSAKVGIAAPAVSSAAAGTNEITGSLVKIN